MNWDIFIGLIIGLLGSVLALIGTIISNRQNHKHQMQVTKQNHDHEILLNNNKQDMHRELEIQRIALENSFKEFELSRQSSENDSGKVDDDPYIYPYDMYLLMYMRISEYMNQRKDVSLNGLADLHSQLDDIKKSYHYNGRVEYKVND